MTKTQSPQRYARSWSGKKVHLVYGPYHALWCGASLAGAVWSTLPPLDSICQNCKRAKDRAG